MKSLYFPAILFLFFACGQQQKTENHSSDSVSVAVPPKDVLPPPMARQPDTIPQKPAVNPYEKASIEVKTFENKEGTSKGTWGYNIYIDHNQNPTIAQPSMPAVPGNNGFNTEAQARKTGEFVAYR